MSRADPPVPAPAPANVPEKRAGRLRLPLRPSEWRFDREPEARLPALLALLLVAALLLQLLLTDEPELPPAGAVPAGLPRVTRPDLAIPGDGAALAGRPLFTPRLDVAAAAGGAGGAIAPAPPPPLGGARVAGTVAIGRSRHAIVVRPDGQVVRMRPGARIAGWTLRALDGDAATFTRGGQRLRVRYGGGTAAGVDNENE